MFELNGIYKVADSENLYNNGKDDYEYNFRVAYNINSWIPFFEVGNVSSGYNTTTTDDRQTRYRIGLGYNFWPSADDVGMMLFCAKNFVI